MSKNIIKQLTKLDKPGLYPWCQIHKWIFTFNYNNNDYRIECSKLKNDKYYVGLIFNGVHFINQTPIQVLYFKEILKNYKFEIYNSNLVYLGEINTSNNSIEFTTYATGKSLLFINSTIPFPTIKIVAHKGIIIGALVEAKDSTTNEVLVFGDTDDEGAVTLSVLPGSDVYYYASNGISKNTGGPYVGMGLIVKPSPESSDAVACPHTTLLYHGCDPGKIRTTLNVGEKEDLNNINPFSLVAEKFNLMINNVVISFKTVYENIGFSDEVASNLACKALVLSINKLQGYGSGNGYNNGLGYGDGVSYGDSYGYGYGGDNGKIDLTDKTLIENISKETEVILKAELEKKNLSTADIEKILNDTRLVMNKALNQILLINQEIDKIKSMDPAMFGAIEKLSAKSAGEIVEAIKAKTQGKNWNDIFTMDTLDKIKSALDKALQEVNMAKGSTDIVLIIEEPTVVMYITEDPPNAQA